MDRQQLRFDEKTAKRTIQEQETLESVLKLVSKDVARANTVVTPSLTGENLNTSNLGLLSNSDHVAKENPYDSSV